MSIYEFDEGGVASSTLTFKDGEIEASAYSHYIDSFGTLKMGGLDTYKLYLVMKEYYEKQERPDELN